MPDTTAATVGWSAVIQIALGAGFASAVFNRIAAWWDRKKNDKQSATYLALRLSVLLEAFAIECADTIIDIEFSRGYANEDMFHKYRLPNLAIYPDGEEWRVLSAELAAKALTFTNEVMLGRQCLSGADATYDLHANDVQHHRDRLNIIAERGLGAWTIASALRGRYGLPEFPAEWKIDKTLKEHVYDVMDS